MKWHATQKCGLDIIQQPLWIHKAMGLQRTLSNQCAKRSIQPLLKGKDPCKEINTFLLQYRSTPHSTTGKSPAELLFSHELKTKLPSTAAVLGVKTRQEIRAYHDTKKLEQKLYADKRRRSKSKKIQPGDKILIKQHKSTTKPPFDPNPYEVTSVKGSQIEAIRDNAIRIRDKNHVKLLKGRPINLTPTWQQQNLISSATRYEDFDIEFQLPTESNQATTTLSASSNQISTQAVVENNTPAPSMPLFASSSLLIDQAVEPPIIHAVTPSVVTAQQVEQVEPETLTDSRVEDNELSDIDSRLASRLSSLLTSAGLPACEIASDPNSSTQTKSDHKLNRDCKLKWNLRMNEGPAVLQDEETDGHNEN